MDLLSQLHNITTRLLEADSNAPGKLLAIENELYDLLIETAGMDAYNEDARKHLSLESGKAIGSLWAAMCIKDILRTKKFVDAVYTAVMDIRKHQADKANPKPPTPLHIMYVGTGPFATLILPLITRFSSEEIQFSFLEINELSIQSLEKIIQAFGMSPFIRRIEKADAVNWQVPPNERVDILICETIQQALTKEPQVSVYMNLVPQLQNDTILIPERIELKATLIDLALKMKKKMGEAVSENYELVLDTVFELSRHTVMKYAGEYKKTGTGYKFPPATVSIPSGMIRTHRMLHISTLITVYKKIKLATDECSLNIPLQLMDLEKDPPRGPMRFYYQTGKEPGIKLAYD